MKKALVVDDNIDICDFLKDFLEYNGLQVKQALSGEEALNITDGMEIDIAFIDIFLPGISGVEMMKSFKRDHPDSLCILMSAYHDNDTIEEGLSLGAHEYLQKPFHITEIKKFLK